MWARSAHLSQVALACRKKRATWPQALQIWAQMAESPDAAALGALISTCAEGWAWPVTLELLEVARGLPRSYLDDRPLADTVMYNDTMSASMKSQQWQLVLTLFSQQRSAPPLSGRGPNVGSYAIALKACEQGRGWSLGVQLLEDMRLGREAQRGDLQYLHQPLWAGSALARGAGNLSSAT
ncbi:unnamed protein product [Durusdinium trenchii]|uniref:Pentatricopeptide repeat-containing protein, chloroplastic n=1 Tax=Durusdinium trenchii TaxID=1381693 RepID=A0ABP0STR3_9DINO